MDHDRPGAPHAAVTGELGNRPGGQTTKRPRRCSENVLADAKRRSAPPSGPDDDGEQLGGGQGVRAKIDEPFPGAVRAREFADRECGCHPEERSDAGSILRMVDPSLRSG